MPHNFSYHLLNENPFERYVMTDLTTIEKREQVSSTEVQYDFFRPRNLSSLTNVRNHIMQLPVTFLPNIRLVSEEEIKEPYFKIGVNTENLEIGDYLSGPSGIYFITLINQKNKALVIKTNNSINLINRTMLLFSNFPVYISPDPKSSKHIVIMPSFSKTGPMLRDVLLTKKGMRYVIDRAELTGNIWKLDTSVLS